MKKIVKLLKVLCCILLLFITVIIYLSYIIDHNEQELASRTEKIMKNYKIDEKILDTNEYSNYYIIKTATKVIVLTKDYKEVKIEDVSKLKEMGPDTKLIYKTNKIMYEKIKTKGKKLTYEYYDATTGDIISKTTLERQ